MADKNDRICPKLDARKINHPTITIKNSVIDSASTFGAAIGMPWFSTTTATQITDACQLSISISGSSDITATSVASAAIGSGANIDKGDVDAASEGTAEHLLLRIGIEHHDREIHGKEIHKSVL